MESAYLTKLSTSGIMINSRTREVPTHISELNVMRYMLNSLQGQKTLAEVLQAGLFIRVQVQLTKAKPAVYNMRGPDKGN